MHSEQDEQQILESKYNTPIYRWIDSQNKWLPYEGQFQEDISWIKKQVTSLTLNVLFDKGKETQEKEQKINVIYSQERYENILSRIGKEFPHFVTLQETTASFLKKLQECPWAREHYYISDIYRNRLIPGNDSFGNILLSRIRPYAIHSYQVHKLPRKIITGFYQIRKGVYLTVSSVHLTAFSINIERREQELGQTINYLRKFDKYVSKHILQGDMNFHSEEENKISEGLKIKDLWLELKDLQKQPGYTFDAHRNLMISEIYWGFQRRRMRLDRIFFVDNMQQDRLNFKEIKVCFDEPIYGEPREGQVMNRFKGAISFIFDRFQTNIFRQKQNYLFCSDHFGLKSIFMLSPEL